MRMLHSCQIRIAATGICLTALLACGGGGGGGGGSGSGGSATTPSGPVSLITPGIYSGVSTTGVQFQVLGLADGTFRGSSTATNQVSDTSSLALARVSASGGNFTSTGASTWLLPGTPLPTPDVTQITGTYTSNQISATLILGGVSTSYTLAYLPTSAAAASLTQVAGAYADTLKLFANQAVSSFVQPTMAITINAATGAISGTLARGGTPIGTVTGTLTPRSDVNAYNVSLTFALTDDIISAILINGYSYQGYALYNPASGLQFVASQAVAGGLITGTPFGFWASGPN